MKLTKNWLPLLGIYLIVGGLAGIVLSLGYEQSSAIWIPIGLLIGVIMWWFHQDSRAEEKSERRKHDKKN